MPTLRPYQQTFIQNIRVAIGKHKRVIGQMPTGAGKTVAFVELAQLALKAAKTVLILSESRKIYSQIEKAIPKRQMQGLFGEPVHVSICLEINAGVKHVHVSPGSLYIGMAQTLVRRPRILEQLNALGEGLVIIADEAHIGTHTKVLAQLHGALLIGVTATPNFDDAKHLPELYRSIVVGPQVSDLIDGGYLCTYRHYARVGADMGKLKIQGGEYTEESQEEAFGSTALFDGLVEDLQKFPYKHGMVFCASIKHAESTCDALNFAGIPALVYHSQCPEGSYNLMQYETGRCKTLVSVGALTKGYDFPPTDLIALVRATTSLSLYYQICGRGSRPADGKTHFTLLDYGSHHPRFGFWHQDVDWSKIWNKPRKGKRKKNDAPLEVAPTKECPECEGLIPARSMVCPLCGELFPVEEKELQQGELQNLTGAYEQLIGRRISILTPTELALYARTKNKKPYATRIARAHEQEHPGWIAAFGEAMGYKPGWARYQIDGLNDEKIEFFDTVVK